LTFGILCRRAEDDVSCIEPTLATPRGDWARLFASPYCLRFLVARAAVWVQDKEQLALQIYLSGAGGIEFDPTNGIVGSRNFIRVAVARDAHRAIPFMDSISRTPRNWKSPSTCERIPESTLLTTHQEC
jgi:hypothetical protein